MVFEESSKEDTFFPLHAFVWVDFVNLGTHNSLIYMLLDNETIFERNAPDEHKDGYWATAERVKLRLDKAKSR